MSADNVIVVAKFAEDDYRVAHVSMSVWCEIDEPKFYTEADRNKYIEETFMSEPRFHNKASAMVAACDALDRIYIVEYGITTVDFTSTKQSIFLIDQGGHSDYDIVAAFSTEKKAKAFKDKFDKGRRSYAPDMGILKMELDAKAFQYFSHFVKLDYETGEVLESGVENCYGWEKSEFDYGTDARPYVHMSAGSFRNKGGYIYRKTIQLTRKYRESDLARAIKVTNEVRLVHKALYESEAVAREEEGREKKRRTPVIRGHSAVFISDIDPLSTELLS